MKNINNINNINKMLDLSEVRQIISQYEQLKKRDNERLAKKHKSLLKELKRIK